MTEETPIDRRKLSTIPSWVMVGFVLGVLAMLGYRRDRTEPAPSSSPPPTAAAEATVEKNASALADQPSFTVVEALFEQYREYAFWEDERTEIAVWNSRTMDFTDCFEVLRADTGTYYRSIPQLTRLPLAAGYGPPNCPIRFTETAAQRAARDPRSRNYRPPSPPPVELPAIPRPR